MGFDAEETKAEGDAVVMGIFESTGEEEDEEGLVPLSISGLGGRGADGGGAVGGGGADGRGGGAEEGNGGAVDDEDVFVTEFDDIKVRLSGFGCRIVDHPLVLLLLGLTTPSMLLGAVGGCFEPCHCIRRAAAG